MNPNFPSDFALAGLILAVIVGAAAIGMVIGRFQAAIERDDDMARAAGGMDEYSAPEGGQRHD